MFKRHSILVFSLALIFFPSSVISQDKVVNCVMQLYISADANLTLADIRERYNVDNVSEKETEIAKLSLTPKSVTTLGVISRRIIKERQTEFDPYVITPYKINYVLPLTTTNTINKEAYSSYDGYEDNF
jgi:phospholipase A1